MIGSKLTAGEVKHKNILSTKWRRYFSLKNIFGLFVLPIGFLQSVWHVFWFMPNVCFSKGGYASVMPVFVCWLFRIPVVIHESDSIAGSSNRFLAKFSKKVCIAYKEAKSYFPEGKVILTGNPVRKKIIQEKINTKKKVLLVLGGSQGSEFINKMIVAILPELLRESQVIHQTGLGKKLNVKFKGYKQVEYINDMGKAYAVSDLILTRAGANTLAEISALGKASVIIPLPKSANDHQKENAYIYSENQAAIVFEQETLGPLTLLEKLTTLLREPGILKNMGMHAGQLNTQDASARVAKVVKYFIDNK